MRVLTALVVATALVWVGAAAADHLEPKERLRAEDQVRARAMLLRKGDLGPGYAVERTSDLEPHLTCEALDMSDLVVTAFAESPEWSRDYQVVGSSAAVYASRADGDAAWRRSTSRAGMNCLRDEFESLFARQGESVRVAILPLAFPKLASARAAYRVVISAAGAATPLAHIEFIVLKQGRAQAALLFAGVVVRPDRPTEIRLARIVAARMTKAMQGS